MSNIEEISKELWENPSNANWKKFRNSLGKSKVKFYKVFYHKGKIAKTEDLRNAYVELYDPKEKVIGKIPVFEKKSKGIRGATIYLKGLLNTNR